LVVGFKVCAGVADAHEDAGGGRGEDDAGVVEFGFGMEVEVFGSGFETFPCVA
jgi:hypothetical protein